MHRASQASSEHSKFDLLWGRMLPASEAPTPWVSDVALAALRGLDQKYTREESKMRNRQICSSTACCGWVRLIRLVVKVDSSAPNPGLQCAGRPVRLRAAQGSLSESHVGHRSEFVEVAVGQGGFKKNASQRRHAVWRTAPHLSVCQVPCVMQCNLLPRKSDCHPALRENAGNVTLSQGHAKSPSSAASPPGESWYRLCGLERARSSAHMEKLQAYQLTWCHEQPRR